jgi:ankyrin repeat protein
MTDLRSYPEQDQEHEGATPQELLIEACRRNNTELLAEVIDSCTSPETAALLLNKTKTVMGNYIYHEAALRGNYEVIDMLLDQEGFECDPINRIEGDTPLHSAVRWLNEQPKAAREEGHAMIEMMLEAGSDPRIRNRAKLFPATLVDPSNPDLKEIFSKAEYTLLNAGDFIDLDKEEEEPTGSGSDSDFDIEEYRRERDARRREEKEETNDHAEGAA